MRGGTKLRSEAYSQLRRNDEASDNKADCLLSADAIYEGMERTKVARCLRSSIISRAISARLRISSGTTR